MGMKGFVIKIVLFLSSVLFVCVLLEILLRQIPNDYKAKSDYLTNYSDSIEVLFLGGSHTLFNVDPAYTQRKSFNAANPSQSLDYDLAILNKYKNNWANLKCIVVPVSYGTLTESISQTAEAWRLKNYVLYFGIRKTWHLPYYTEIMNGQLLLNIYRIYNYYIKHNDDIVCTELGWNQTYRSDEKQDLEQSGVAAAKRHTVDDLIKIDEMSVFLDSIVKFSKEEECSLVLFTSPVFQSYMKNINQEQLTHTYNIIDKVIRQNRGCFYFNMLDDSTFTAMDFYDGDHMNEIGAQKFTRKLDSLINSVFLADKKSI